MLRTSENKILQRFYAICGLSHISLKCNSAASGSMFPVPYPSFLLLSVVLCPLLLNRIFGQWVVGVGWWFDYLVVMVPFLVFAQRYEMS